MLTIYNETGQEAFPLTISPDAYSITHKANGYDVLEFEIPDSHELYPRISEEIRVIGDDQNRYAIKSIDEHGGLATVTCELDLDDWRQQFWRQYRETDKYLSQILESIKPSGWSVSGAGQVTKRATVEASDGQPLENVTAEGILSKAVTVYDVAVHFDVPNKVLKVILPKSYTTSGEYLTDELNLRSLGFNGNSSSFATRLYAYGKKDEDGTPITFASINGGKEYVEDNSYNNRVISVGWSDERYTVKENLLAAAKEKLAELAYPVRSYECDVVNLDEDMWLYKVVTLIDRRRKTRVNHQVVEYKEYPLNHSKDVVTLSTTAPRIENSVKNLQDRFSDDLAGQSAKDRNWMQAAIDNATRWMTGKAQGHVIAKFNAAGEWEEILIMDTKDMNTAKEVWRWNLNGFGHSSNGINGPYTTAITIDGKIVADFIAAGSMAANIIKAGILSSHDDMVQFDLDNSVISIYVLSGEKKYLTMQVNNKGLHFYDTGSYLGKIGTNQWKTNPDIKGLVFDLDTDGGYMAWAKRLNPSDEEYTTVFSYYSDSRLGNPGLRTSCPLYTDGNPVYLDKNAGVKSVGYSSGDAGFSATKRFVVTDSSDTSLLAVGKDAIQLYNLSGKTVHCYNNLDLHGYNIQNQSDVRLKTNITRPEADPLSVIQQLDFKAFDRLDTGERQPVGIIAQQLAQLDPFIAYEGPDGVYRINESLLLQYALMAIQQLAGKSDTQPLAKGRASLAGAYTDVEKQVFAESIKPYRKQTPVQAEPVKIPIPKEE